MIRVTSSRGVSAYQLVLCCLWSVGVIAGLSSAQLCAQEMSAEELIAKSLQNRMAIESYELEVRLHSQIGPDVAGAVDVVHCYLDKQRLRVDLRFPYEEQNRVRGLKETHFWHRTIYTPDSCSHFCNMISPDGGARAATVDTDPQRTRPDHAEALTRHDLRSLGYHFQYGTLGADAHELIRDLALPEKTVYDEIVAGQACKRVSWKLRSGYECDLWISPEQGYSPVKIRGYCELEQAVEEIHFTVAEWKNSGVWFPVGYRLSRSWGGKVQESEEATILVHSLNETLADSQFELGALGIPVGRAISRIPSAGPPQIWDGEKAVLKYAPKNASN